MANQGQYDKFLSKLDSKPRGTFELSASDMYNTFHLELKDQIYSQYVAGKIRSLSAFVCAKWVQRAKTEIEASKAAYRLEIKKEKEDEEKTRKLEETKAAQEKYTLSRVEDFSGNFPDLSTSPTRSLPSLKDSVWSNTGSMSSTDAVVPLDTGEKKEVPMKEVLKKEVPKIEGKTEKEASGKKKSKAQKKKVEEEGGLSKLSAAPEQDKNTGSKLLGVLMNKRVLVAWYGEQHIGVVKSIDSETETVKLYWESESSQSSIHFSDILALA